MDAIVRALCMLLNPGSCTPDLASHGLDPPCTPDEVEIEARIRPQLVNAYTIELLYAHVIDSGIQWEVEEYLERKKISKNNRKCTYRQRDTISDAKQITICKSSIAKADVNDAWCTMHVSVETRLRYAMHDLSTVAPVQIKRHRVTINGHYVDIVQSHDGPPRVEVEVCDAARFDPSATLDVVRRVCTALMGNAKFIGYYDWTTAMHIKGTHFGPFCIYRKRYQKPTTMTINVLLDIADHTENWVVTPKIDGIRRFLVLVNGMVFSVGLTRDASLEGSTSIEDITILDCELANGMHYVFDIPVYKGQYIGDHPLYSRLETAREVLEVLDVPSRIKEYEPFTSFEGLSALYRRFDEQNTIDGMIFVDTRKEYMHKVAKWKPCCTVDLELHPDGTLRTCDDYVVDIEHSGCNMVGIWEFAYDSERRALEAKRYRYDKPQANSWNIVQKNIYASVPGTLFTGRGFYLMRKYHNAVKKQLIDVYHLKNSAMMDIGTGQGGDITKWDNASVVYCVEPNERSISDMRKRLEAYHQSAERFEVIKSRLADIDIRDIRKKVSTFTAFFCMNQWADDDWVMLEKVIKAKGTKKCRLLAIAMTDPREHKSSNMCIKMRGNKSYNISLYGTRIVDINETPVSPNRVAELAKRCNMKLMQTERLLYTFMTEDERTVSAMYKLFVYGR